MKTAKLIMYSLLIITNAHSQQETNEPENIDAPNINGYKDDSALNGQDPTAYVLSKKAFLGSNKIQHEDKGAAYRF